jgi:hypothetical protein
MFSPFDYILWAVILILECAAAYLTFSRQKWLSILLGFRAAADLLGMILLGIFGMTAFRWEDYLQRMIQFPILGVLAVCCAGAVYGDSRGVRIYSGPVAAVIAVIVAAMHGWMPWKLQTVIWIEEKTVFGIAALVAAALIFRVLDRRGPIQEPWGVTSAGLLMLLASYALAALAREYHWINWMNASRCGQLGAVAAYVIWTAEPCMEVSGDCRRYLAKVFSRLYLNEATAKVERLINSTANNSYGKAQRIMARRIIEELRRIE